MISFLNKALFASIFAAFCLTSTDELQAAPKKSSSYATKNSVKKVYKSAKKSYYKKKAPYAGYGKESSVNGTSKTKIINGHIKKTSKGYTYVNPYARSK